MGYKMHGIKRRVSSFNTTRIYHLDLVRKRSIRVWFCITAIAPTAETCSGSFSSCSPKTEIYNVGA
ncbi:GDP-D-mannose 4/ 6-dehydratase domain protein [Synechococcus sp. RS9915]|nr:GDP-D-mannose 4/ 6-dehydratase domain protein [Synechococcus sp. RS9915]